MLMRRPLVLCAQALALAAIVWLLPTGQSAMAQANGSIAGVVTAKATSHPIANIEVCASSFPEGAEAPLEGCAQTNAMGEYKITELQPAGYEVFFSVPKDSTEDWVSYSYGEKPGSSEATEVSVAAGQSVEKIDAELVMGGRISGTIIDATTHQPLEFAIACAAAVGGEAGGCGLSVPNAAGAYTTTPMVAGQYQVAFIARGYELQFYNGAPSLAEAQAVTVTEGATTASIDASMKLRTGPTPGGPLGGLGPSPIASLGPGQRGATGVGSTPGALTLRSAKLNVAKGTALLDLQCAGPSRCHDKLTLLAPAAKGAAGRHAAVGRAIWKGIVAIKANTTKLVKATITKHGQVLLAKHEGRLAALLEIAPLPATGPAATPKVEQVKLQERLNRKHA
jgi:hypothetical protein